MNGVRQSAFGCSLAMSVGVVASAGCTAVTVDDACAAPVASGEYSIHVVGLTGGGINLGLGFDWDGDATFSGHIDYSRGGPVLLCSGSLEPAEVERLTRAVNDTRLFCQRDLASRSDCSDWYGRDITIQTTDDSRTNRFCAAGPCPVRALGDLDGALRDPIWRLWNAGACDGPPVALAPSTDLCFEP